MTALAAADGTLPTDVLTTGTDAPGAAATADRARSAAEVSAELAAGVADVLADAVSADRRAWWRSAKVRKWTMAALIVAALGFGLAFATPYVVDSVAALRSVQPGWIVVAIAVELVSMAAFARTQRRMLAASGVRVPVRRMVSIVWAANAVNATLPGGSALSWEYVFRKLRRQGATVPAAGFTLVASGVLSSLTFGVLLLVGAAGSGSTWLTSTACVVVGVILVGGGLAWLRRRRNGSVDVAGTVLRLGDSVIGRGARVLHRSPEPARRSLARFVGDFAAIRPRRRDWVIGFGLAGLNWFGDLVCLFAATEAVGMRRGSVLLIVAAYAAGMSASGLSLLPGSLGAVDAAMILTLTAGGVRAVDATAAVVLYRLISFVLVVSVGWLVWVGSWLREKRHPAVIADPETSAPAPATT